VNFSIIIPTLNEDRGKPFEKFYREKLAISLQDSPIKKSVAIIDQSVKFKPSLEEEEDLDIVVIISDTVLIVEVKCIIWPDDSIQFANYRDTVEKAVKQIARKQEAVQRNYDEFSDRLKQLGYIALARCCLVSCVLTNSAVYSGFSISGIPIIDLSLIESFFKNEHVKIEVSRAGEVVKSQTMSFYTDAPEASRVLGQYLANPPQVSDLKTSVKNRRIIFPVENNDYGKLIYETYSVQIDVEAMESRYGMMLT
jgi:hypothetical protein